MFKKIVGLGFSTKGKNAKDIEEYIASLVKNGANEFFTGYNPHYWYEKFGFEISPNGRFAEHEQITDFETLKKIVEEVHKHKLEIFVNLNAWYYSDETMPLIEKMIGEINKINIDGIICGNIGVLEYLKEVGYAGKINLSTILSLYNKEAIQFFLENYKINKIILSRELTLKEIESLLLAFPEMKFEVFGEGDFCRYNNGLCFAEHKYSSRDICTIVVNDLVIKKRFLPDFKKIILDEKGTYNEKIEEFDDSYEDKFYKVESLLGKIFLFGEKSEDLAELKQNIFDLAPREDLFFDAMKPINSKHNKNILSFLKGVKYLLSNKNLGEDEKKELQNLEKEITKSFHSGFSYFKQKIESLGGQAKLKALELGKFYAKGDNLNLYAYLFFAKFSNLETVKFPTRGRIYAEKIALIEMVLKEGKVGKQFIDRGLSLERAHYDMSYLFGEKLWFRKMIQNIGQ
ncbi:hypothetical protein HGA92_04625 [Candidatus Gracilibacteria bacterium]|nr:hypothetical protein [Candidatus Gracilibacteria bacterium]NUJ98480.1 hypothetical protein [Candidatus Gracilibacteria bacterium]